VGIDIHAVQQFTENVGLLLAAGGISDAYGLRMMIAIQVIQLSLAADLFAANVI